MIYIPNTTTKWNGNAAFTSVWDNSGS